MRAFTLALALALPGVAAAQAPPPGAVGGGGWSTALYVDAYFQEGSDGYLVPTVFLDRDALHLEGRFNYEAMDTWSLFAGWSFPLRIETATLRLTPMLGGVAGLVNGVAPGLEVDARFWRISWWLEAEYLVDLEESSDSFLYTWSELYVSALDWLWAGASIQRLKEVESPRELDVGPMIGAGKQGAPGASVSFYAYGLTRSSPTYLVTAAATF